MVPGWERALWWGCSAWGGAAGMARMATAAARAVFVATATGGIPEVVADRVTVLSRPAGIPVELLLKLPRVEVG